jgi:hypothetical protein
VHFNKFTVTAHVTVPTLADTEQLAAETTVVIGSFAVTNMPVSNKHNRAVAVQLPYRPYNMSYLAAAVLLLCRSC